MATTDMNMLSVDCQNGWTFHTNHGREVKLSNDNRTAEFSPSIGGEVVISRNCLMVDKLYEVHVDDTEDKNMGVYIGVVTEDPKNLRLLAYAYELQSAICIYEDSIFCKTKKAWNKYGRALKSVKTGSRVGVAIDAKHSLHLYVNGKDQGIACSDVKQPCYAIIDFFSGCRKISTLPLMDVH